MDASNSSNPHEPGTTSGPKPTVVQRGLGQFFSKASGRFAFEWWGFIVIAIVLVLVGIRVRIHHKQQANQGLLGRPLRVGIVPWPGYAGGLVANNGLTANKDCVFWRDQHLFVEFVVIDNDDQMRQAFVRGGENGGVDVMWSTVDSLAQQLPELLKEGVRPKAFMQVDWSYGADAIIVRKGIEQIEDFKGLKENKIAVSMAASQWLFEHNLVNSDLSDDDLKRIRQSVRRRTSSSPEARDLFINNDVDVAVLWEPDVTTALRKRTNARLLTDTRAAPRLIADVMVAKEEFIRAHRNVIKGFINGWRGGTAIAINDPMRAVKVLMDSPGLGFDLLGEATTREVLGKTVLTTLDDNAEMFGLSDGDVFFDTLFDRAMRVWLKAGYITSPAIAAQARDVTLLQEIYDLEKESVAETGCEGKIFTRPLPISFPADKGELSAEAMHILDDPDLGLLLRTNSDFRVCVEADIDERDNPRSAGTTRRAREDAVIKHLIDKHRRPPTQFVSASAGDSSAGAEGFSQHMRLRLVAAKPQPDMQRVR